MRWVIACVALLCGCESLMGPTEPSPPQRRPTSRPEPRIVPLRYAQHADQMAIMVGAHPRDTDGDGYPDLIDVTAMLMEGRSGDPVFVAGRFEFEFEPLDESVKRPWRVWIFTEQQSAAAAGPTVFDLPGYMFSLDLRTNGGDRMPATAANLTGRFMAAAGGRAIEALPGQRVVQLGSGSTP
jgi:hypothetical protein